mgnify:CR=1 FL=1|tara:strand:- start:1853 stop:3151 length:1299 start_codon:yes stop_codon:yes gene_type:complete
MKLILLELNEINFDVVKEYIDSGESLPGFNTIIQEGLIITSAETEYEELEPWIQWPSVHTGLKYNEHKIFRLGDFVTSRKEQFFEKVERAGYSVGAISPMNASNNLKNPSYFIPDPWTKTTTDDNFLNKIIAKAISQAVNDNSKSKLTFKTIISLCIAFLFRVKPGRYLEMTIYALSSLGKPWRKALFLDKLLHEVHISLIKKHDPEFSTLFLNAGAHIQHHYFFNSKFITSKKLSNPTWYIDEQYDPLLEMLKIYDSIIQDLKKIKNADIIIATGLSQKPYDHLKFYYRLNDHELFLKNLGINFRSVTPRMTRDFLICFDTKEDAQIAEKRLSELMVNENVRLFNEIDNRGCDIFVVLTYSSEIKDETSVVYANDSIKLKELVTFVAIKNGEHQSKGFAYFSKGIKDLAPNPGSHVSNIHNSVLKYFGINF